MPSVLGRAAQLANPGIARLGSPGSPVPAFAVPKPKAPSAPSLLSTPQQMMPPPRPSPASQILASGAKAQPNGALVRLYVASADPTPTGTPPASSISEVEAFFLPCLSSTTSRVWKIEVRRDCVVVSVAPEDRAACLAKSGATLGGTEVGVSVAVAAPALVRLYISSADPTGTPLATSVSEVEAFFLPCLSSTTSRVWKIEVRRDCVLVSVAPEDRDACLAKSGATLGGAEVTVSVATPQQLSAAAAGRPTKKAVRPPGVEKERRAYRDGLSYRCGKCGAPKKGHKCDIPDDAPPLAADDPRRWVDDDGPPLAHAVLEAVDANGLPIAGGGSDTTPPDAAAAGGAARRKKAAAAAAGEVTVFEDMVSALGKDGSPPKLSPPDGAPPAAKLSEMDLMLADLAFAARPPPVITPDESGANGPNSGGSGDLGGGIASISPSAFSPGEMIKMMGTPTPAPVKDDRSAKSPEAGSDQGSSAAGDSA